MENIKVFTCEYGINFSEVNKYLQNPVEIRIDESYFFVESKNEELKLALESYCDHTEKNGSDYKEIDNNVSFELYKYKELILEIHLIHS